VEFTTCFGLQSQTTRLLGLPSPTNQGSAYWPFTSSGQTTIKRGRVAWLSATGGSSKRHNFQLPKTAEFGSELIPFHSPLLWKSLLLSFSPLSDMLKFSGQSRSSEVDNAKIKLALAQAQTVQLPIIQV
jgi:hypothetical protein